MLNVINNDLSSISNVMVVFSDVLMKNLLQDLYLPNQLKELSVAELEQVAAEVRHEIIEVVSKNNQEAGLDEYVVIRNIRKDAADYPVVVELLTPELPILDHCGIPPDREFYRRSFSASATSLEAMIADDPLRMAVIYAGACLLMDAPKKEYLGDNITLF